MLNAKSGAQKFVTSQVKYDANHFELPHLQLHNSRALYICNLRITLIFIRDHSNITSVKRWMDGVRKWQFLLIYSTIYADVDVWA